MRFAVDTGGTFTDLVVAPDRGPLTIHKSATVPSDPVQGILDVFDVAATERGVQRTGLLEAGRVLLHGTTRGLNAVLTGSAARTALLTTGGHPDILVLREGGRTDIFDLQLPYPDPYIPRRLTFEIPERVAQSGAVIRPLDEEGVRVIIDTLRDEGVESVAVCLLWSIVNPRHELRVRELLAEHLPEVPVSLSHEVNPCLREYRRASSTALDASLKPIMSSYVLELRTRLREVGFDGRLLIVTSSGAALDAEDIAATPVHSLNSGPSMAPVAGRHFAQRDAHSDTAIVADTGGTSYDVSVVRRGRIPWTRETWLGKPFFGHMTGFPSVDVRSVGAGGGSIAYVDEGGLLHVGPVSAGADPGPACYGRGGVEPTVTDACVVLGILDPDFFLGGRQRLDSDAARGAIERQVAERLHLDATDAAAAILRIATERMVSAIEEITIHQGLDPSQAVLVGGGGAAGFNSVAIARQLGCPEVIIPSVGPTLSAAGALMSDLSRSFEIAHHVVDSAFDFEAVSRTLMELERRASAFIEAEGADALESSIEYAVEARYASQVWELEVPLRTPRITNTSDLQRLQSDFHATHRDVFAVADEASTIEFQSWHARARCRLSTTAEPSVRSRPPVARNRSIQLPDFGRIEARVWHLDETPIGVTLSGPAVIEAASTTVVVDPLAVFARLESGTLHITPNSAAPLTPADVAEIRQA